MGEGYGHLKISRKAYAKDPFWIEPREFSKWEAWEDLIQRAAWKTHRRMVQGHLVSLDRGQLLASERFLADAWRWSRSKVRRFLDLLVSMERIQIDADHEAAQVGSLITLCNYDEYQSGSSEDDPPTIPPANQGFSGPTEKSEKIGPPANHQPDHQPDHEKHATAPFPIEGRPTGEPPSGREAAHRRTTGEPPANQREGSIKGRIESKEDVVVGGESPNDDPPADAQQQQPPAGRPGPGVDVTTAAEKQPAIQAMEQLVEKAAAQPPEGFTDYRVRQELESIVDGDDFTAWHDANGEQVPWQDRPRVLKLALRQWYLDLKEYPRPRSALRYVIGQQYNPHQLPTPTGPTPGSEASQYDRDSEPRHYQQHRDNGVRRQGDPKRLEAPDLPEGGTDAQDWARDNPDRFKEFIQAAAEAKGLDLKKINPLERLELTGLALERVREEVLCETGSGPGS